MTSRAVYGVMLIHVALMHPNMNPGYLATLVFVGSNRKLYMPPKNVMWQRYLRKLSKNGKLLESELGLIEVTPPPE